MLREEPEGPDEEYARRFRETKTLKGKLDLFKGYLDHQGGKCRQEAIDQMAEDLASRASGSKNDGAVVETAFSLQDHSDRVPVSADRIKDLIDPILHNLNRAVDALEDLKGASLQKRWFTLMEEALKEELSGAYERLLHDGPDSIRDLVAEHVSKTHEEDVLSRLFRQVRPQLREEPGLYIWYAKDLLQSREKAEAEGVTRPGIIENLIGLHEVLSYRAKTGPKEQSADLRAHMSEIRAQLKRGTFKRLREIMKETDRTTARELWKTVEGAVGIEDRIRKEITGYIMAHFPNIAAGKEEGQEEDQEPAVPFPNRLLCLRESYESKTKYLHRLKTVEIPENTQEVETARLMGDLRENAEYHAAKEKQGVLLALSAQLEQEIASASVVSLEDIPTDYCGFGSKIRIRQEDGEREVTLLGPWESKPEANILSYLSPMGRAIWGRHAGEVVDVEMGDRAIPAEIVSIQKLSDVPSSLLETVKQ
jgi:transcription elongation GreA/GreB family factor